MFEKFQGKILILSTLKLETKREQGYWTHCTVYSPINKIIVVSVYGFYNITSCLGKTMVSMIDEAPIRILGLFP